MVNLKSLTADLKRFYCLRGLSLWGFPVPNTWLGGIKNINLAWGFESKPGFWQTASVGMEIVEVADGRIITLRLKSFRRSNLQGIGLTH
jgi:hypothetical protein